MSPEPKAGFEPWAWIALTLAVSTGGLLVFLGCRPGGPAAVLAYRHGLMILGWSSAAGMLLALGWCGLRRPVLQRGRAWPLAALAASLWLCSLPIAYPSSHEGKSSTTRFRLPFEGVARVRFGADGPLRFDPSRRFGTVFEAGESGLSVVSPAGATVVSRFRGKTGEILVLATEAAEFFFLEGLEGTPEALLPGATVEAGEPLGRAPVSLTVFLQDRSEPERGEGIPVRFFGYSADGRATEAGVPLAHQEVSSVDLLPGGPSLRR